MTLMPTADAKDDSEVWQVLTPHASQATAYPGLILQVSEEEHVFLLTMHHSVTDGWSTGIIWKELSAAYNAFHRGKVNVGLDPLPIQYADFASWQRQWLAHGVMSEQVPHFFQAQSSLVVSS